jgi:hypothetical protein
MFHLPYQLYHFSLLLVDYNFLKICILNLVLESSNKYIHVDKEILCYYRHHVIYYQIIRYYD